MKLYSVGDSNTYTTIRQHERAALIIQHLNLLSLSHLDAQPVVKQLVPESVQFGEINTQVGDLEQVLHLITVWVGDLNVWWQHSEDYLGWGRDGNGNVGISVEMVKQSN